MRYTHVMDAAPRTRFKLHSAACIAMAGVCILFVWLHLDFSRDAYVEQHGASWRGGVRHGFPLPWWDGGEQATAGSQPEGGLRLTIAPFRNVDGLALSVDLLALAAALAAAAFVAQRAMGRMGRMGRSASGPETAPPLAPKPAIRPATALLAAGIAGLLCWANLRVETSLAEARTGAQQFQEMGWPLPIFVSSHALPESPPGKSAPAPLSNQSSRWIQDHAHISPRLAHWFLDNIALNVLIGLACICVAGAASEKALRR